MLFILEAMKMQFSLTSPRDGVIEKIFINNDPKKAVLGADVIFSDKVISLNDKVNKKKILFVFMIFIICFTWNPKAVHHEDIGSIPIYRVIAKIIKYY